MPRYVPEDSLQSPAFHRDRRRSPGCRRSGRSTTWTWRSSAFRSTPASPTGSAAASGRMPCGRRASCSGPTTPTWTSSRSTSCPASTTATSRSCRATPSAATQAIEAAVRPIVEAGVVPLLIGGDHACTLPHLRATRVARSGRRHRLRLAHRRLGQLLRRAATTTGRGCAGRSRRGSSTSRTPSRSGCAGRSTTPATGPASARSSGSTTSPPRTSSRVGPEADGRRDPRAGRRSAGLHQLRHRRRRPGLRARAPARPSRAACRPTTRWRSSAA